LWLIGIVVALLLWLLSTGTGAKEEAKERLKNIGNDDGLNNNGKNKSCSRSDAAFPEVQVPGDWHVAGSGCCCCPVVLGDVPLVLAASWALWGLAYVCRSEWHV